MSGCSRLPFRQLSPAPPGNSIHKSGLGISGSRPGERAQGRGRGRVEVCPPRRASRSRHSWVLGPDSCTLPPEMDHTLLPNYPENLIEAESPNPPAPASPHPARARPSVPRTANQGLFLAGLARFSLRILRRSPWRPGSETPALQWSQASLGQ